MSLGQRKKKPETHTHNKSTENTVYAHGRKKNEIEIVKENGKTRQNIKKKATHLHIYIYTKWTKSCANYKCLFILTR